MTSFCGALDNVIPAAVVAVLHDHVVLGGVHLLRCTEQRCEHVYKSRSVGGNKRDVPNEPRPAIGIGAVLAPRTEVVPAPDALPACAHDGEVVLAAEELLWLASEAISEVRFVDMAVVQPEALPVKTNRPDAIESERVRYMVVVCGRSVTHLTYVCMPCSVRM